jgi:thiol:disulfide interchange protein DsbD
MRVLSLLPTLLFAFSTVHAAPATDEHITVELVSERSALVPGSTAWFGLRLVHAPHWHTYWINPGDSGLPTRLTWTLPAGYAAGDIAWPLPKRFDVGGLANFGYDGDVLLPVPVTVPADATVGTQVQLTVEAKWLVCHEECIPGKATLALELPVANEAAPIAQRQAAFAGARAAQPQPTPLPAQAKLDGDRIEVIVGGLHLPDATRLDAFAVPTRVVANARPRVAARDGAVVLTFAKSDYFTSMPPRLDFVLRDGPAHAWLLRADVVNATPSSAPTPPP